MPPVVAVCQKPKPRLPQAAYWAYLAVVNAAKSINDANGMIATVAMPATVMIVTSVSAKMAAAKSANVNAAAANAAMWIAAVAAVVAVVEVKAATPTVAVMTIKHAVFKSFAN